MVDRRCRNIILITALILSLGIQNVYAASNTQDTLAEKLMGLKTGFWQCVVPNIAKIFNKENEITVSVQQLDGLGSMAEQDSTKKEIVASERNKNSSQTIPSRGSQEYEADRQLLAKIIFAEARGESFEGQVAVGAVILNRVEDSRFPDTIKEVVFEPGQFTPVNGDKINFMPDRKAYLAAEAALEGIDPTNRALYYYNPKIATDKWIKTRPVIKHIGNHTFCV